MMITPNKQSSPMMLRKKYPLPQRSTIEELKKKYECSLLAPTTPKTPKPKSPKKLKKSKVKQMASMFNSKISQIIKRDADVAKYSTLINEFSPESKPQPIPMPRSRLTKEKAPVPSPRSKSKAKLQPKAICFVAEDVFGKLSVKDKAQLYTQFIEDMSKKNPKFGIKKTEVQGEVIQEKQGSVKQLLEDLETNCGISKQTISPVKEQRIDSMKRVCSSRRKIANKTFKPVKSKEFEDLPLKKMSHIYTFTVTIHPNSEEETPKRAKSMPLINPEEPNNEKLSSVNSESPKKLCLSRFERLTSKKFFESQQMETLFFTWLKAKQTNEDTSAEMSNQSEIDEEKQKSTIDRLLEEALTKLEVVESKQKKEEYAVEEKEVDTKAPVPAPRKKRNNSSDSSTTNSAKQSERSEESESGLSSLPKITSEESQPDTLEKKLVEETCNNFEFAAPLKPLRKKKMRRNPIWKKEINLKETNTVTTTDSESDCKTCETKTKNKKRFNKPPTEEVFEVVENPIEPSFIELDPSFMRVVNSPRKIKSAYTLTVNDLENSQSKNRDSSRCWSSEVFQQIDQTLVKEAKPNSNTRIFADSLTDQGFETEAKDFDSPIRTPRRPAVKHQDKVTSEFHQVAKESSFGFSTPIKNQLQQSFSCNNSAKQQLFSPIIKPLKNRRKSLYDSESRRSSLVMQVIREDQPLEPSECLPSNNTEQQFFANAPTLDMTSELTKLNNEKYSQFWIKCGDFSMALDINYNDAERLRLLYEIFSQTSCGTKDLHFGIDNHIFSVHNSNDHENITARIPSIKGHSHYWVSTGDLAIPFTGKYLSPEKIQRLFQFIKATVEETGILRFGVDEVEFSNVPEFWNQSPKFSMESNYSMLVGLQSGHSNGLEGRSKFAWPHSKPVQISDLDHSDYEGEDFEEIESGRLSYSPFGSNHYDLSALDTADLSMPRNSDAMMSLESYCYGYTNEPLDNLFDDKYVPEPQQSLPIPEMSATVRNQQQRLSLVKERLSSCYAKPTYIPKDALDTLKGTPEYLIKLKRIVSDISNIGCSNNFRECSVEQLDSYMYYLKCYADICLNSCSDHMDNVLEALADYKAVVV